MMPVPIRRTAKLLAVIAVVAALLISFAWGLIHTQWFAGVMKTRIVSVLQDATGGRVELGVFSFNADTLHTTLSDLVIHGTEPIGSAPLLRMQKLDIDLRMLSWWRRDLEVNSLSIKQPQINILIDQSGKSNLPKFSLTSETPIEEFFAIKAKHVEVQDGLVKVNDRAVPISFAANATSLVMNYQEAGPHYEVAFNAEDVSTSILDRAIKPVRLVSKMKLYGNRAEITKLNIETAKQASTIQLSGQIPNFAHPEGQAHVNALLSIDELAQVGGINAFLQRGSVKVSGNANINFAASQFTFAGKADARGTSFLSPAFSLREISATSNLSANRDGLVLRQTHASARGAYFEGGGTIKGYRFLQVEGHVSQVALKEVGSYLTSQNFPWSGLANGSAHASARLGYAEPDFVIGAKVNIDAGSLGIPTAGKIDVTYYDKSGKVEFGESTLNLPHTKASLQGTLGERLLMNVESSNLADLQPLIPIFGARLQPSDLPVLFDGGTAHFHGALNDVVRRPAIEGEASLNKFRFRGNNFEAISGNFHLSPDQLLASTFEVREAGGSLNGRAQLQLGRWVASANSAAQINARFSDLDIARAAALLKLDLPAVRGSASGNVNLVGSLNAPQGICNISVSNIDAFGEKLNQLQVEASLDGDRLRIRQGKVQSGQALLTFSGVYQHNQSGWRTGELAVKADSNGFPLSGLTTARKYLPAWNGRAEIHLDTFGKVGNISFEPLKIDGKAQVTQISLNNRELGNVSMAATTQNGFIQFKYAGDLRQTEFSGAAQARLIAGTPVQGDVQLKRISFETIRTLVSQSKLSLPLDGYVDGGLHFEGGLEDPAHIRARAIFDDVQISSHSAAATSLPIPDIVLHNQEPVVIEIADGVLSSSKFEITGRDTRLSVRGSAPLSGDRPIDLEVAGTAELGLFKLLDPNVRSSGSSEMSAHIAGTLSVPKITGSLRIRNGSFFLPNVSNGLSDVDGTVLFSRNRATIQKMTAHSGGGDISLGGSVSFGESTPLVYHLDAAARNVRVRYANSISVTANSDLRLSGTSVSSLLAGTLTVNRVVFTPNADAGNLLAAASSSSVTPAKPEDVLSGLHLDIGVESAPNLQVSTNLSRDVEAEVQLRLRGTPDHPIILGTITANQGDIKIFGTRFSLNRGEVSFVNAVRVEPVLDLDLETQARGVTVDITVSGTPTKLNFNYRSDPPLQPRDIIALLTVGRTPDVGSTSNAKGASDVNALTSGVNSVLGQAISPVSNRLSKLFGVTNIRIDPFVQGITNTPQARLSVEQQISRAVTVTYITNLSQTSEQIFRFEWALNRQFSIVAIRDDNGEFGIDFQIKKRFK